MGKKRAKPSAFLTPARVLVITCDMTDGVNV